MGENYKAVEVSAPGELRLVERAVPEPGAGQVRIRVEACGSAIPTPPRLPACIRV
jgi:NADPH:quinone reductase-like Zn-dependent oxidoreductase